MPEHNPIHSCKYSTCIISFHMHSTVLSCLLFPLFFRRGNWGIKILTCRASNMKGRQNSNVQFDPWVCKRHYHAILSHLSAHHCHFTTSIHVLHVLSVEKWWMCFGSCSSYGCRLSLPAQAQGFRCRRVGAGPVLSPGQQMKNRREIAPLSHDPEGWCHFLRRRGCPSDASGHWVVLGTGETWLYGSHFLSETLFPSNCLPPPFLVPPICSVWCLFSESHRA